MHPELTVLVAENGRGKTAVIDAIKIALCTFIDAVSCTRQQVGLADEDVHLVHGDMDEMLPAFPTEIEADACVSGQQYNWRHEIQSSGRKNRKSNYLIIEAAERLYNCVVQPADINTNLVPTLPFVASYGTERLWSSQPLIMGKKEREMIGKGRLSGYSACLSSSSSFKGALEWYEATMGEIRDPRFPTQAAINLMMAVEKAMQVVLKPTGWCKLDWNSRRRSLIVEHKDGSRLPFTSLSDGVRNIVALVMDIARRCATLNPHFEENAAEMTPGILLIDEVDLHLHPGWQQEILRSLREAFPLLQFIVTTHSPQVLSTVQADSIRIIRDGHFFSATPGTDGAEAQRILEDIFGVSPRPNTEMAIILDEYLRLVDARQWDSSRALELRRLLDDWSQGHEPRLLEADIQIDNMKWEAGQ